MRAGANERHWPTTPQPNKKTHKTHVWFSTRRHIHIQVQMHIHTYTYNYINIDMSRQSWEGVLGGLLQDGMDTITNRQESN